MAFTRTMAYTRMEATRARKAPRTPAKDAIELLKADHRQVEELFAQFEKARKAERKRALAKEVCNALKIHTALEEEIFYPAFIAVTGEQELHDEALIEHEGAKRLIAEIEDGGPGTDKWEARVSVLREMIKHHVKEEEQRGGMFAKAKAADMDLAELGGQLARRKTALANRS